MIELPYPPSRLSPNSRTHWAPKSRVAKSYRQICWFEAKAMEPTEKFKVTFHPPDKRKRDRDNIIASFKAGQDGLADAWGIDDNEFEITYALGEPRKGGAVIVEAI